MQDFESEAERPELPTVHLSAQAELRSIIASRRKAYETEPPRILEDYRNEISTTAAYNGRQLLELLQNADDAARHQPTGPRRLLLRLTEQELLAANTGMPFSAKGIRSILFANLSAKFGEPGYIGAKGLGFRALLNWSPCIRIDSGPLHVAFAPAIAHDLLDRLRTDSAEVRYTLADEPNLYPIAVLRCPKECAPPVQTAVVGYDTIITLDLTGNDAAVAQIQTQLSSLTAEVLVFLQHLDEVVIESPAVTHTLRCTGRDTPTLRVGADAAMREWHLFTHSTWFEGEEYYLKAAWNAEWEATRKVGIDGATWLHVFFPTRVALPFPLLLHGPFEVTSNRDFLLNDPAGLNRHLLSALATLLVQVAEALRSLDPADRFGALRLVWDRGQVVRHGLDEFDFAAELRRHLLDATLWPRVDGSFSSVRATRHADLPFARYLPPSSCPTLLAAPATPTDQQALTRVLQQVGEQPSRLPLPTLLAGVAAARLTISKADYAQLLRLLVQQLQAERPTLADLTLPALFTGRDNEALVPAAASPVFLPPDEATIPAAQVPVRLLDHGQALALRAAFGVTTFADLAKKLAPLHVRAYSFTELMRALVMAHTGLPLRQLHQELFRFFQAEHQSPGSRSLPERPADLAVPMLTLGGRKSRVLDGHRLYFGKAYGNARCEELYHYDLASKLVAPPAALGLSNEPLEAVQEYLRWCGVAEEPRLSTRILTSEERRPYAEYVLRHFNYRESLGGEHPRSYTDLRGYVTSDCYVTTLDDLPQLLQRSKRLLTILEWVQQSASVSAQLVRAGEPASSSLLVRYGSLYNYRTVPGKQMSNFLAWQFATLPWLQVEGHTERVAPARTVLSTTITGEFRPHLFRLPVRETRSPIGSLLFTGDTYKQTLLRVGVRETIESVDVGLIYEVLRRLADLDPTGRAAGSIYKELAENFTWRPDYAEHESYQQFCQHGKVWCRTGVTEQYLPLAAVQYLPTADLAPALQALFPLLALAPGHKADDIKRLLGVASLPPLGLRLSGIPQPHPLQASFDDDWLHLRPYLYAFRKDKSSREESLRRLQELRIQLCITLPVVYEGRDGTCTLELTDYRFLFIEKGNRGTVWLRIPTDIITLAQLQQEPDAGEAVAQILSLALEAGVDKTNFELLFAANRDRRDGLIRNKLPGLGPDGLADARRQFDYAAHTARNFWLQLARATGTPRPVPPSSIEGWPAWLHKQFAPAAALLPVLLAHTDWEAVGSATGITADELLPLWELFVALALEPARFHKAGSLRLNFAPLFERELLQQRDTYRQQFEGSLRTRLWSANVPAQQRYLATVREYLSFMPSVEPTLRVPPSQVWQQAVSQRFELLAGWEGGPPATPTLFNANREQLRAYGVEQDIPAHYIRTFLEDAQHASMLYFEQLPWLRKALRAKYQPPADTGSSATSSAASDRVVQLGSLTYRYGSLRELREQLEAQPRPAGRLMVLKPQRPVGAPSPPTGAYRPGGRPGTNGSVWAEKNGQTGFLGELFAYWRLCDMHGADNVVWESGNALAAGLVEEAAPDDSAGYDLRYRPTSAADWRRVEVKSGWEPHPLTEFQLSSGELAAGRYWGRTYELLLVAGVSLGSAGVSFARIEAPFLFRGNKSFLDNPYFEVATRIYHLRFRV